MQSQQARLAFKIEAGRIYGLRQEKYERKLQKELKRMPVRTQPMW